MLLPSPPQEGVFRVWSGTTLGTPPEGAPHGTPLWGALRGNSRPIRSGPGRGVVSSESKGFPPQYGRALEVAAGQDGLSPGLCDNDIYDETCRNW